MSLPDLMDKIESVEFDAAMNVFSGLQSFLMALHEEAAIQEMISVLLSSATNRQTVFNRLRTLLGENDEPQYAHPHDVALSGYLYVLQQTDLELAAKAAKQMAKRNDLSWSQRLAQTIREAA